MDYIRRPPITLNDLVHVAASEVHAGRRLLVVTDFDMTVSREDPAGNNPFLTQFDETAAHALATLQARGQVVGVISNRAAAQIADRWRRVETGHPPIVVGTYGYEIVAHGKPSVIDPRFASVRMPITEALQAARLRLLGRYGMQDQTDLRGEQTIETPDGRIYLEMKGVTHDFPEGLAHVYNFNDFSLTARAKIIAELDRQVQASLEQSTEGEAPAVAPMWGTELSGDPDTPGWCSWLLKPTLTRGKAYGLVHLLRAVRHARVSGAPVSLVVYVGDHKEQDGHVMWAGKVVERTSQGQLRFIGVLADADKALADGVDHSDLHVPGVQGVQRLLSTLALAIARHP